MDLPLIPHTPLQLPCPTALTSQKYLFLCALRPIVASFVYSFVGMWSCAELKSSKLNVLCGQSEGASFMIHTWFFPSAQELVEIWVTSWKWGEDAFRSMRSQSGITQSLASYSADGKIHSLSPEMQYRSVLRGSACIIQREEWGSLLLNNYCNCIVGWNNTRLVHQISGMCNT